MISKISFEDGDSLIVRVVASVVEVVVAIVAVVVARIFKSIALVVVVPKKNHNF